MNQAKQSRIEFETWEYILPAMQEIAKVSAKGFAKYGPGNWARIETKDNINHAIRHICLYRDKREGVPLPEGEEHENHLAHACARLMMEIARGKRRSDNTPVFYRTLENGEIEKLYVKDDRHYCPNCGERINLEENNGRIHR